MAEHTTVATSDATATSPERTPTDVIERNAVTVSGTAGAPVIVFGHGYGTDQSTWRPVAQKFAETHRLVTFDYVGAGTSDLSAYDPQRYDSLDGYATDLIEVIDALGVSGVTFVAHSVSGMIGALASIRRPELFAKIIMICPSPRYVNDGDYIGGFTREDVLGLIEGIEANQSGWAAQLAPAVTAREDRPDISERVRKHFATTPQHVATHFARVVFLSDVRDRLSSVTVPCVVLQSSGDIICPPHIGRYLRDHLVACTLIELTTAGHFVHLTEPELIASCIRDEL